MARVLLRAGRSLENVLAWRVSFDSAAGALKPRVLGEEFLDDGTGQLRMGYRCFAFAQKPSLAFSQQEAGS